MITLYHFLAAVKLWPDEIEKHMVIYPVVEDRDVLDGKSQGAGNIVPVTIRKAMPGERASYYTLFIQHTAGEHDIETAIADSGYEKELYRLRDMLIMFYQKGIGIGGAEEKSKCQ